MKTDWLEVRPAVAAALRDGRAVVALESTLIAHGLPWPDNKRVALEAEAAVRDKGAVPATIAIIHGRAIIGLDEPEVELLARGPDVRKASARDLGAALAQRATAATTVAATMRLADRVGIRVFATGGIGGVHPTDPDQPADVSADLLELARTPVAVVCAGAKSILDLPATLEVLETQGVPVLGYGTTTFPAFYAASSGLPVTARVDSPGEAAAVLARHWELSSTGVVLAQPLPERDALPADELDAAIREARQQARAAGVAGPALTPYLLAALAVRTGGRSLRVNHALILANARLAAAVARALVRE